MKCPVADGVGADVYGQALAGLYDNGVLARLVYVFGGNDIEEHAMQMSEMQEMKEMAKEFIDLGVQFSEITNHEIIWQLPED